MRKFLQNAAMKKNETEILAKLNELLEFELSGITRYLHYSFMVFGPNRIPITGWLRNQAQDGMNHATLIGEWITAMNGHPTVRVLPTPESNKHDIKSILSESLEFERTGLAKYIELLHMVRDHDVALEEFVRGQIQQEQEHIFEMDKMLRN